MQIVSDRGMDLAAEQMVGLDNLHLVPLTLTLDGQTYRSGVDIQPEEFYRKLATSKHFPTTSQPAAGDFAAMYRKLAATDPEILSIHISSGLSGTLNAAREGARMVPEAHVTFFDTMTLSAAEGWQVEAAARAASLGWSMDRIVALLTRIRASTNLLYTLDEMQYLIHGGRISHLKGLLASVLQIKPVIGVSKEDGRYVQQGQARTFKRAIQVLTDLVARQNTPGSALRLQVMHTFNPAAAMSLRGLLERVFDGTWLPTSYVAPVLGAHTGPSLIGVCFAPQAVFDGLPWISGLPVSAQA
jgi:DegV family protein with EDD domain